jgi:hypothetical protein
MEDWFGPEALRGQGMDPDHDLISGLSAGELTLKAVPNNRHSNQTAVRARSRFGAGVNCESR